MPNLDFFRAAGLFLEEDFLSDHQCRALREEMLSGQQSTAALERVGVGGGVVDPYSRKTKLAEISKASRRKMMDQFSAVLPRVAEHFHTPLQGLEEPNYLIYREGDFFAPHLDVSKSQERHESRRKVSLVLFLNDQSEVASPDGYAGGALTFYGLQPPPFQKLSFPLAGKTGLLVGFRSEVLHEVKPVIHGTRFTVVGWCQ